MKYDIPFALIHHLAVDDIIIALLAFAFAMLVSGEAQGYLTYLLGYDDPAENKRIFSFNPLLHTDPFGLITYVLTGFGWTRRYLPEKPIENKFHLFILHLSGPIANLLMANIVGSILYIVSKIADYMGEEKAMSVLLITNLCVGFYGLLLPIPPMPMGNLIRGLLKSHGKEKIVYPLGVLTIAAIFAFEFLTGSHPVSGPINFVITKAYLFIIP